MPLVTVVIPTINRPHLVQRAVQSALDQTLTDIEVIVVVDGPDDAERPAGGVTNVMTAPGLFGGRRRAAGSAINLLLLTYPLPYPH
jgi:GT2 family glycosyltransferase